MFFLAQGSIQRVGCQVLAVNEEDDTQAINTQKDLEMKRREGTPKPKVLRTPGSHER